MIDLSRVRQETPGCSHVIHFNNAGASLMPLEVVEAMQRYLTLEAHKGGYEAAQIQATALHRPYAAIAELLNATPEEIALFDGATRAWDMAFYSHRFQPGDRILTSRAEYSSNYLAMLQVARQSGAMIELIPDDLHGQISVEALEKRLDEQVKLIALTHIPTSSGLVNPAAKVGQIARKWKIPYLLDACQSVGQLPLDVEELQCDMLSAAGRKFLRGPRGTGFLYVRSAYLQQLEPHYIDSTGVIWESLNEYRLLETAKRFEQFEYNYAAHVGLGIAIDYALELGLDHIWQRIQGLAELLRSKLSEVKHIHLQDPGKIRCGDC